MNFDQPPTLYNGKLINPRVDLRHSVKMSPYATMPFLYNSSLPPLDCKNYFKHRFPKYTVNYTLSGTEAIKLALKQLKLTKDDVVTVFTTSQNFYVSGCITKAIENFSQWSRKIEKNTKVIYINHEFGFPYPELNALKKYNLPIIEDCAYSFSANNDELSVGSVGEFLIFSLTKFFPMNIGGLLLSRSPIKNFTSLELPLERFIKTTLSHYLPQVNYYNEKRRELYHIFIKYFSTLPHFKPRFLLNNYDIPGAFIFYVPEFVDLPKMKIFFANQGIESSIFYNESAFFLPLHQNLTEQDIYYFYILTDFFYRNEQGN